MDGALEKRPLRLCSCTKSKSYKENVFFQLIDIERHSQYRLEDRFKCMEETDGTDVEC